MVNTIMSKLTLRELVRNWFQYLSMFVITVLAVTLFLGFISNTDTLRARSERYLEVSRLADVIVQAKGFDDSDKQFLSEVAGEREGTALEYRIYSDGEFAFLRGGEAERNAAKIFVADGSVNRPYIAEAEEGAAERGEDGLLVLSEDAEGVLLDKTVANLHGYSIGDEVTVTFTSFRSVAESASAQLNSGLDLLASLTGKKYEKIEIPVSYSFRVQGLLHSVEGVNIYSNSPVYLTPKAVERAVSSYVAERLPIGESGFPFTREQVDAKVHEVISSLQNQALLRGVESVSACKERTQDYFGSKEENTLLYVYTRDTMESVVILDNEVSQSRSMLYVFPVIFFLVSILVTLTSISRLILRERINIGTMKALGMTSGRIVLHYAMMGVAVTFLGCVVGAIIGPLIVPAVMTVKYGLIFSMPKLVPTVYDLPWTFGLSALYCLLSLAIGFWAARSVIKENPAECMRPKQIAYAPRVRRGTGRSKESRHLLLSCRMAIRNIRINAGRSLMTVIGVMGCAALLVTSFGIGDTMTNSVENDYGRLCYYDVTSPYTEEQEEDFFSLLDGMKEAGGLDYERTRTYVATAHTAAQSKDISVYVIPDRSIASSVAAGGCTMSRITADVLGVEKGDTFTFTQGASPEIEYTVEDIVVTSTWNGFFIPESRNAFPEDCYFQENIWVKVAEGCSAEGVRDALNAVNGTNTAKTLGDRRGEIESLISSTNAMKYTLMVFAIALSVVVLYNLSLLNVKERTRDMATLKVLGFTDFQVSFSLIVEILLLTLIGTACGTLLGYPLMFLVMKLNEMATMAFAYAITPLSYLCAVAIALGTAIAINFVFGLTISRISMTESLKSVE